LQMKKCGKPRAGKMPDAQVLNLATLVDYASGSIVSRTLAKCKGGSITLFAFDAGQELSEHVAPFDALVQILDGRTELVIGGRRLRVASGESVLMPAGVPHSVKAAKPFKMLLTMLRTT
jgi:quercetin dioxygenase-like cupin family protein